VSGNLAKLNRVLLVALCKNAETANTIADRIEELERENAALRHTEENLAATVRGLEFELEKAEKTAALLRGTVEALGDANDRLTIEISGLRKDKERLDWLNTHCMSADPIMGRSTYRWTIEHDEPDIRAAIDAAQKETKK
jgi:FtsZ-binding cell division protein ZapB